MKAIRLLSEREIEVIELVAQALTNKEIANHLSIAEKTVKNHVYTIMKLLHAPTRMDAAATVFPPEYGS